MHSQRTVHNYYVLATVLRLIPTGFGQENVHDINLNNINNASEHIYRPDESKSDDDLFVEAYKYACGIDSFCEGHVLNGRYIPTCSLCGWCFCDNKCSYFGDCCPRRNVRIQKTLPWTCEGLNKVQRDFYTPPESFLMVKSCPMNRSSQYKELVKRCERADTGNIIEVTPASDPATNVTYRNKFCAQCNDVHHFKLWQLKVECDSDAVSFGSSSQSELWSVVLGSQSCSVREIAPPWLQPRLCETAISACTDNGGNNSLEERLCRSGVGPTYNKDGITFANIFCALCNGYLVDQDCRFPPRHGFPLRGLSVLLRFIPNPDDVRNNTQARNIDAGCLQDQTFDPFTKSCVSVRCAPRWVTDGQKCRPLPDTAFALGYELDFLLHLPYSTTNQIKAHLYLKTDEMLHALREAFDVSTFITTYEISFVKPKLDVEVGDDIADIFLSTRIVSASNTSLGAMESTLFALTQSSGLSPINCKRNVDDLYDGWDPQTSLQTTDNSFVDCMFGKCVFNYVSLYSSLHCPHIDVNLTTVNHTYNDANSTLEIFNQTLHFESHTYIYCQGILKVCTNLLQSIEKKLNNNPVVEEENSVKGIISAVCMSLSLFCLLLTFTIFCVLSELRTLPVKNAMGMIFHLFCAQLLFLTGIGATQNRRFCQAMGVLIHLFWLEAFSWMAICALHMCLTFTRLTPHVLPGNSRQARRTILAYIGLSHVIPITFVSACVGYHLNVSHLNEIGYGGSTCFITEPKDIGIFFAAPVAVVLLFNAVCFIQTVRAISRVPSMKCTNNQTNKSHVDICFRLSVLLGLTWTFGFLAAVLKSDVLWYTFDILNGLQGVFICLAYCGIRRTRALIRSKLRDLPSIFHTIQTNEHTEERVKRIHWIDEKKQECPNPILLSVHKL